MITYALGCMLLFVFVQPCVSSRSKLSVNISMPEDSSIGHILAELESWLIAKTGSRSRRKFRMINPQKILTSSSKKNADRQQQQWLHVDEKTGTLTLSKTVDREEICQRAEKCTIQARIVVLTQHHPRSIEVNVLVEDVNDNDPIFPMKILVLNRTELWPIKDAINLDLYQAKDLDSGNSSKLTYKLSPNPYFQLRHFDDESGYPHLQLYLLKNLDYEAESIIELDIQATDSGIPQRSAKMYVAINVLDVNDNYPEFEKKEYTVSMREGTPAGSKVIQVSAKDADNGAFGAIRYFLSKRNTVEVREFLKIDQRRGIISLLKTLDWEAHGGLRILLEARDSDPDRPKIGEAGLVINVEDVNDNPPTLNIDYLLPSKGSKAYLSEISPKGTFVAHVSASDDDTGLNGDVEINVTTRGCDESKDFQDYFQLTSEGFLESLYSFDRESCNRYEILFEACDHGVPRRCLSKSTSVVILDENEYVPVFESSFVLANVSEDAYIGTVVAALVASDNDSFNGPALTGNKSDDVIRPSRNGDVFYSIVSGGEDVFTIGKRSGKIRLMSHLDREEKSAWKLRVSAQDGGSPPKESFADIIIQVIDVNDNPPKFTNPSVNCSVVYANVLENKPIATLKAADDDIGENAKVSYFLLRSVDKSNQSESQGLEWTSSDPNHNCSRLFVINPNTGELRLNFSNENLTKSIGTHDLEIKASDSGDPALYSVIILRVVVGKYPGTGENLLTHPDKNKQSSLLDPFYVTIMLGSLALLLILLVVGALIKCKLVTKKLKTTRRNAVEYFPEEGIVEEQDNGLPYDIFQPEKSRTPPVDQTRESTPDETLPADESENKHLVVSGSGHSDCDSGKGDSDLDAACNASSKDKEFMQTKELRPQCGEDCRKYGHGDSCWMPINNNSPCNPTTQAYQPQRMSYYGGKPSQGYYHEFELGALQRSHCVPNRLCCVDPPKSGIVRNTSTDKANGISRRPFERRHSNPCLLNSGRYALPPHILPWTPTAKHGSSSPLNAQSPNSNSISSPRTEKLGMTVCSNLETVYESDSFNQSQRDYRLLTSRHFGLGRVLNPNSSYARVVPCSRAVSGPMVCQSLSAPQSPVTPTITTISTEEANRHLQEAKNAVTDLENMLL